MNAIFTLIHFKYYRKTKAAILRIDTASGKKKVYDPDVFIKIDEFIKLFFSFTNQEFSTQLYKGLFPPYRTCAVLFLTHAVQGERMYSGQ